MLTLSSPPLLLHVPKNTFQEGLLHDFSKECSGTEKPTISQITLLTDGCSICLSLLWISCALCDLPKVREQPLKRCQSASSASWDAAHLALGTCMGLELLLLFSSLSTDLRALLGKDWNREGTELFSLPCTTPVTCTKSLTPFSTGTAFFCSLFYC